MTRQVTGSSCFNVSALIGVTIIVSILYIMRYTGSGPDITGHKCHETITLDSADMMKPDELLALKYAVGTIQQNLTKQHRYLRHIRALMTGPPVSSAADGSRPRPVLKNPNQIHYSQIKQSEIIDQFLNSRRNGFFVDCGAHDGEWFSNSLFFELHRNWTGLLIESETPSYKMLLQKNRYSYTFGGCLSPTGKPQMLPFRTSNIYEGVAGVVKGLNDPEKGAALTPVFCVPLADLLAAIGRNHVDYLSLDIEGAEPEVLETMDWNRVKIDVMTIEHGHTHSLDRIRKVVEKIGLFREVRLIEWDIMYARKD